jgi:hypothetical protein
MIIASAATKTFASQAADYLGLRDLPNSNYAPPFKHRTSNLKLPAAA